MRRPIEAGEYAYLRSPAARDRGELLDRVRASRKLHGSWEHAPSDETAFEEYLRRARRPQNACFFVCRIEDDAIAGVVNLSQIFYGPLCSAYVGYYALAPFERQGHMTEGVRLVLRHAFGRLRLHRVEANVQPGNSASIALLKRLGFRREVFDPLPEGRRRVARPRALGDARREVPHEVSLIPAASVAQRPNASQNGSSPGCSSGSSPSSVTNRQPSEASTIPPTIAESIPASASAET